MADDHQHYYVDRSGGFDWPRCIICGKPVDDTPPRAGVRGFSVRACCQTPEAEPHVPTCQSVDARVRRGQTPFPTT